MRPEQKNHNDLDRVILVLPKVDQNQVIVRIFLFVWFLSVCLAFLFINLEGKTRQKFLDKRTENQDKASSRVTLVPPR